MLIATTQICYDNVFIAIKFLDKQKSQMHLDNTYTLAYNNIYTHISSRVCVYIAIYRDIDGFGYIDIDI